MFLLYIQNKEKIIKLYSFTMSLIFSLHETSFCQARIVGMHILYERKFQFGALHVGILSCGNHVLSVPRIGEQVKPPHQTLCHRW